MIKEQIDASKTFKTSNQRISALIRAADLLWPSDQTRARAVFADAFELAIANENENEQKGSRSLLLRLQTPDQRYVVIRAVTKRDAVWAKELLQRILKKDNEGEPSPNRNSFNNLLTAERLLEAATQMISSDVNAASDLARISLDYPACGNLVRFLYRLAAINQQAADQLYAQALAVYGNRPMGELLYLQAYPFAWRETLNTPVFSFFEVPANFVINQSLQRRFIQVILRRAQQALETPADESDTYQHANGQRWPGKVHLLLTLIQLEPLVSASLPDLLAPLVQARENILVSLPVETQTLLLQPGREIFTTAKQTFNEQIESAQKVADVDERDGLLATAVFQSEKESVASVVQAIDKISDSNLQAGLREWFYFQRTTAAIQSKRFEEAEKFASRVEGHEQRAYLLTEIAKGLLTRTDAQTHAVELLDQAVTEARKIGASLFAVRTLLSVSTIYLKIDTSRSISVLADAVNTINRIEAPDFLSDNRTLVKKPERRGRGGQYSGEYVLWFYMPGLDPESAFREIARIDFDTALSQSSALTDKFQRTMSMLSLAEVCIQQAGQQPKAKPRKGGKS